MFNVSRYYSPEINQSKYLSSTKWYFSQKYVNMYKNYSPWYEWEVCMNCWCDLDWHKLYDCTVPADWRKLKREEAMKVVACSKEYKLWTKFAIEWLWIVVCRDRWWAIKNNRIDLWMWYWDVALNNRGNIKEWEAFWYIIE